MKYVLRQVGNLFGNVQFVKMNGKQPRIIELIVKRGVLVAQGLRAKKQ